MGPLTRLGIGIGKLCLGLFECLIYKLGPEDFNTNNQIIEVMKKVFFCSTIKSDIKTDPFLVTAVTTEITSDQKLQTQKKNLGKKRTHSTIGKRENKQ